jgi:hypothetical protein
LSNLYAKKVEKRQGLILTVGYYAGIGVEEMLNLAPWKYQAKIRIKLSGNNTSVLDTQL